MSQDVSSNYTQTTDISALQILSSLPSLYLKTMSTPSASFYAEEKRQATWKSIWLQLLVLSVLSVVLLIIGFFITPPNLSAIPATNGIDQKTLLPTLMVSLAIGYFILTPISFFIGMGIFYLCARLLGGQGSYREQFYTALLFGVPTVLAGFILSLIPVAGSMLALLPHIYGFVLFILLIKGVHQLGTGKAILTVLLPIIILGILSLLPLAFLPR